jgi:hypothetical protein
MKTAYINSLQIHSNSDTSLGFYLRPNIQGLEMPDIRLPSFERPNVDGAFVPNQLYGGRPITLEGRVSGNGSITTYRTRRRQLEAVTRIYRPSDVLTPVTFKFTTMDDLDLQVEAYTRKLTFADVEMNHGNYVLDLYAPNLRILSQTLKQQAIYIFEGGGMGIPMAIPSDWSTGSSTESAVNNEGNHDAYPYFIIYGTIEDPQITNTTTGESFSLDYTLTASTERIEVDVRNRTVVYYASAGATGTNIRDKFTGDWFELSAGNNTLKLTVVDTTDTGYALVQWRDSYIGI